jgi:GAF domain-containing protein
LTAPVTPEEIDAISAVAGQVAVAIHNARLYERERRQRQTTDALLGILSTAAEDLSLKKALIKICQSVLSITVGDRCSVLLLDEQGKTTPMMSLARNASQEMRVYLKSRRLRLPADGPPFSSDDQEVDGSHS